MRIGTGLDLETTGLLHPDHRIIELSAIAYDLDTGARLASLTKRFNPGRPIDPKAEAVHKITFAQVEHEPMLHECDRELGLLDRLLMRSEVVFAHNGVGFDFPFLAQEYARIGRQLPSFRQFDTMVDGRWATPMGKPPNLGELCFACRVSYDPSQAHAAEYDVSKMAECFFFALKRGFYSLNTTTEQLKEAA